MVPRSIRIQCVLYMTVAIVYLFPAGSSGGINVVVPSDGIRTITDAITKARPGDTVLVEDGTYHERVFIKAGVTLRAKNTHAAKIDGKGRGTAVTMASNTSIIGFTVKNATIGVFSKDASVSILKNKIMMNWQTGIISVRHLPQIEDNIIVFNRASGFQGWDVRTTATAINHNTVAYNANHGIAIGGTSDIVIENNIVAYNERFGLKLSSESDKSRVVNNNFYENLPQATKIPEGNHSFNPAFVGPKQRLNFSLDPKLCCQIKATDNENLGARIY